MIRQLRPSAVSWIYVVLVSALAFASLSCGDSEQEPEDPIIIVEEAPEYCDDINMDYLPECLPRLCESMEDAADDGRSCGLTGNCGDFRTCVPDGDFPHAQRCQRQCIVDSCESSCGEGMVCNPDHRGGEPTVLPNGEILGFCAPDALQDDMETCGSILNCDVGSTCQQFGSQQGQCQPICDPAEDACSIASREGVCIPFSNVDYGLCALLCEDNADCPSPAICANDVLGGRSVCLHPEVAPPPCEPTTCAAEGAQCGTIETCGETLSCGSCDDGERCGSRNTCICAPRTCAELGAECGSVDDGCGGELDCGGCVAFETCGESGTPSANLCQSCVPFSCEDLGAQCGPTGDGCGGELDCGGCDAGETCGVAGNPDANQCVCQPSVTCESAGVVCGSVDDGCGNTLVCDECPGFESCGGGGEPEVCGCTPTTCEDEGRSCGSLADGCGTTLNCGECADGYCDGGQCESGCDPVRQLGCPASDERCGWQGSFSGYGCVPLTTSPTLDGFVCESGECGAGSLCTALYSESICRSYCNEDWDCSGFGSQCVNSTADGSGPKYCTSGCDPVDQTGCLDGLDCLVLNLPEHSEVAICERAGSSAEGDFCFGADDCGAGMTCVTSQCRVLCDRFTSCADGGTCEEVQSWDDYGVCG